MYQSPWYTVVPNELGKNITPSVLFFKNDQIIVGEEAKHGAIAYPEQVVHFVKRHWRPRLPFQSCRTRGPPLT